MADEQPCVTGRQLPDRTSAFTGSGSFNSRTMLATWRPAFADDLRHLLLAVIELSISAL